MKAKKAKSTSSSKKKYMTGGMVNPNKNVTVARKAGGRYGGGNASVKVSPRSVGKGK